MKITAFTDGPYVVEGEIEVVDANGKTFAPKNKAKFALCRCGQSSMKPFCDGTHAKVGFKCPPQP
jgi:CDGSH-type Zn-finger protein